MINNVFDSSMAWLSIAGHHLVYFKALFKNESYWIRQTLYYTLPCSNAADGIAVVGAGIYNHLLDRFGIQPFPSWNTHFHLPAYLTGIDDSFRDVCRPCVAQEAGHSQSVYFRSVHVRPHTYH